MIVIKQILTLSSENSPTYIGRRSIAFLFIKLKISHIKHVILHAVIKHKKQVNIAEIR